MRTVPEWIGRNDDAMPPASVKDRIIARQNNRCALSGKEFRPGDHIHFDHATPLWLGGRNVESNIQAVLAEPHARKTATEATVRAKITRQRLKHLGIYPASKAKIKSRGFQSSRALWHSPANTNPELQDGDHD